VIRTLHPQIRSKVTDLVVERTKLPAWGCIRGAVPLRARIGRYMSVNFDLKRTILDTEKVSNGIEPTPKLSHFFSATRGG
jgi:hypothetical protein